MAKDYQAAVELDYPTFQIHRNWFGIREWDDYAEYLRDIPPLDRVEIFADMLQNECEECVGDECGVNSFTGWLAMRFLSDVNWLALATYYMDDIEDCLSDC